MSHSIPESLHGLINQPSPPLDSFSIAMIQRPSSNNRRRCPAHKWPHRMTANCVARRKSAEHLAMRFKWESNRILSRLNKRENIYRWWVDRRVWRRRCVQPTWHGACVSGYFLGPLLFKFWKTKQQKPLLTCVWNNLTLRSNQNSRPGVGRAHEWNLLIWKCDRYLLCVTFAWLMAGKYSLFIPRI